MNEAKEKSIDEICRLEAEADDQLFGTPESIANAFRAGAEQGYDAGQRDTNESLTRQLSTAKAALEATVSKYDHSDNGTCAVCRIGHRLYDTKGKVATCEWDECLSHAWHKALEEIK